MTEDRRKQIEEAAEKENLRTWVSGYSANVLEISKYLDKPFVYGFIMGSKWADLNPPKHQWYGKDFDARDGTHHFNLAIKFQEHWEEKIHALEKQLGIAVEALEEIDKIGNGLWTSFAREALEKIRGEK